MINKETESGFFSPQETIVIFWDTKSNLEWARYSDHQLGITHCPALF